LSNRERQKDTTLLYVVFGINTKSTNETEHIQSGRNENTEYTQMKTKMR